MRLTAVVTVGCALVGTGAAFAVERTAVPLRRLWSVLVVIPLAIPDFVVGYAWVSLAPDLHGLWGASLVMTLALYPLVYLPVAASLRRTDPALEEAARSLGCGPRGDLPAGDPAPDPAGPARRLPGGGAGPAGRVRGLRDPALPDLHHHDLRRGAGGLQLAGRLRPVAGAGALGLLVIIGEAGAEPPQPAGPRSARRRPRPPYPAPAWGGPTVPGAGRAGRAGGLRPRRAGRRARSTG